MGLQSDKPIIGHTKVIEILGRSLKSGRVAHAYLFIGPSRVGKNTVARWLAEELLSGVTSIRTFAKDNLTVVTPISSHPDVTIVRRETDAKSGKLKSSVSVEQVRDLRERLSMSSLHGGRKVAIVEEADQLNSAAANALLKTLEEPTPKTHLILIAAGRGHLPETIYSRCEVIRFGLVGEAAIREALASTTLDAQTVNEIAQHAAGRPGVAIDYASDLDALEASKSEVREFETLINGSIAERLNAAGKMLPKGGEARAKLLGKFDLWERMLRDRLLQAVQQGDAATDRIVNAMQTLRTSREAAVANTNPQITLENFLIKL
ncbi:MAG: AAA family ATPase [Candidatus Uhrbacteria bacterium]|nr:AAA family ATPase [Patescibacteria group bacterium]MBU1906986.1 AAA family ATPase [Patescibacteria group bacterium]